MKKAYIRVDLCDRVGNVMQTHSFSVLDSDISFNDSVAVNGLNVRVSYVVASNVGSIMLPATSIFNEV